jgi:DNA-binding response OmpR family regulator
MNILIVADNSDVRYLLELVVHGAGHTPILTTHVDQALAAFKRFETALVILDLCFSNRDSFRLIEQLHRQSNVPIIAITKAEDHGALALEQGASVVMPKPFSNLEFQTVIREQLAIHAKEKLQWL